MAKKVTEQYFCDFCGEEIDVRSPDGIHVFVHNNSKEGIVVKPFKQILDAHRQVTTVVGNGDFCNLDHFVQHINQQLAKERRNKGAL